MNKILSNLLLAMLLAVGNAHGADTVAASHKAAIEKFFKVTKMDKQYEEGMLAAFDANPGITPEQLAGLTEDQKAKFRKMRKLIRGKMVELMGWEKIKSEMVDLYGRHFTEEEVLAITKLMDSPTGQLMVTKQIGLIAEAGEIGRKKAQALTPELTKMAVDAMK
jgi:hypothetical protein